MPTDPPAATLLTDPAARADALTAAEYREIYDELRDKRSLDKFCALIDSAVHKSWWSQYEAGKKDLTWERKNELRRAVGLPALALPVAELARALAAEAVIWRIGDGLADRVILITPDCPSGALVSVNGAVHIVRRFDAADGEKAGVTPVTNDSRARPRAASPCAGIGGLQPATRAAHDARRRALGLTWDAYLRRLLEAA